MSPPKQPDNGGGAPYILSIDEVDADTRLLLFHGHCLLIGDQGYYWSVRDLRCLGLRDLHCLPLQQGRSGSLAAVPLTDDFSLSLGAEAVSTRSILLEEGFDEFVLIGRGSQLSNWYRTHQFCGCCGASTRPRLPEAVLHCPRCEVDYYPRINPCVIVLVTRGRQVLLARHARRNTPFHSCLAGFIEAGETPEEAVAREVAEETGVRVDNIRYFASQSWPFPSQLMLGYYADYAGGIVCPDGKEIAEAGWFPIDRLPRTPAASISIAGQLIEAYGKHNAIAAP